jgi:hypothetical protein
MDFMAFSFSFLHLEAKVSVCCKAITLNTERKERKSLEELTRQQQVSPKIAFRRAIKSMTRFPRVHVAVAGFQRSMIRTKSPEVCVPR